MKNFTEIILILDESGSMNSIKKSTLSSLNEFIQEQKNIGDNATLSIIKFNSKSTVLFKNKLIKDVTEITNEDFSPSGMTALYDCLGNTINSVGEKLNSIKKKDRPDKVLFIIFTDGEENNSKEFSSKNIKDMIEHQTNKYNWQFVYMGANQDAIFNAKKMGIDIKKAIKYEANNVEVGSTYKTLSKNVNKYRMGGSSVSLNFDNDR